MTLLKSAFETVRSWWRFLIKGVVLLAAGAFVITRPTEGYLGLSILFSFVILSGGVTQVFLAVNNRKSMQRWGWMLVSGILELAIGFYLVSSPIITMVMLPFIVGFWLLSNSFYLMGASFDLKNIGIPNWGWLLFGSILMILVSMVVLYYPDFGVVGIIAGSAAALLIGGFLNILLSLRLRSVKKAIKF